MQQVLGRAERHHQEGGLLQDLERLIRMMYFLYLHAQCLHDHLIHF